MGVPSSTLFIYKARIVYKYLEPPDNNSETKKSCLFSKPRGLLSHQGDSRRSRVRSADPVAANSMVHSSGRQGAGGSTGVGHADKAIENLPAGLFDDRQNEVLDVIRGKSGHIELTSLGAEETSSQFKLIYNYEGNEEDSGNYILDLINGIYVFTK